MGTVKKRRVSEGGVLPRDERIKSELQELRHFVDNFNVVPKLSLRGDDSPTYKQLSEAEVFTTKVDGWEFGYQLEEYPTFFRRKIFVMTPGYKLEDVDEEERKGILTAVYDACLDRGSGMIDVLQTADNCLLIQQDFMPVFLSEASPGLLVPGNPLHKAKDGG